MSKMKLLIALVVSIIIIALRYSALSSYFTFESLVLHKDYLHGLVDHYYWFSVLAYILFYIVIVAVSFPAAAILTMLGGFIFGILPTIGYVNIGATIGAIVAFLVSRYLVGTYFQVRYKHRLNSFNNEINSNGHNYLLTLRLIPIFPFFLINIFSGLTHIPLYTFVWTTALGIIPGTFIFAFAGNQLDSIESSKDILSFNIMLVFLALALLAIAPVIYKKLRNR